ncbi:mRNA decapping complex subunit 2 [Termitomyces sp. J132]|nr:mRNA decapping complex subunit 2 [Termitomyces sp. J132]
MTSSSSSSPEIQCVESQDRFSYKLATHEEVLDDLSSRFILNLPDDELSSLERICFQVEQAHWFYEDFIREENPKFPSLPLKKFSEMLFQACPLLQQWSHDHESAYTNFMQYKTRVPVCGAIMLNDTWEKCVLVKGWKASSGWGFPKGKINQVEPPANCAIREVGSSSTYEYEAQTHDLTLLKVLEETGYNLAGQLNPDHVIETTIREQKISLFIVPGVPEDYPFKTKTRKEISKIEWFRLADLPTWKRNKTSAGRFYLISPFIGPLKAFINANKPHPSRKFPKSKKAQSSVSRSALSSTAKDAVHESTCQPSSAETREPHTPSPRYSKPFVALVSQIPDEGMMDPHFANLLSALAKSASKNGTHPLDVVSTSNLASIEELKDVELTVSEPASLSQETPSATLQVSTTELAKPGLSPESLPPVSQPNFSSNIPVNSSVASAASIDTAPCINSLQPSTLPEKFSLTSHTKRSSDSNLSKQHIALLDAVSNESARMQEAYKTAAANGVPINDNFLNPIIATTAVPSYLVPRGHEGTLKYPASTGSAPPSFLASRTMDQYPRMSGVSRVQNTGSETHLQERPRTNLAYRGDLSTTNIPGSGMNQSQLLALMNGSPANPPILSTAFPPPYRTLVPEPQLSPFAPQMAFIPSNRSLASAQMMSSHIPIPALPATSSTLLSILNGE